MLKFLLTFAASLVFTCDTAAYGAKPLTFVLAGQSNMVGMAQPVPVQHPSRSVVVLRPSGRWAPATDPLYVGGGVGPSLSFARLIHQKTGRIVRLIPCASSGSALDEWLPGEMPEAFPSPSSWLPLYDQCRARIGTVHVDGLIFYQGETDATLDQWASTWADRFATMVADWRRDLALPQLPVVFAQIDRYTADPVNYSYWATVQAQQASVSLPRVSMVTTVDLPVSNDGIHLSAASYAVVGRRFAVAWLAVR